MYRIYFQTPLNPPSQSSLSTSSKLLMTKNNVSRESLLPSDSYLRDKPSLVLIVQGYFDVGL